MHSCLTDLYQMATNIFLLTQKQESVTRRNSSAIFRRETISKDSCKRQIADRHSARFEHDDVRRPNSTWHFFSDDVTEFNYLIPVE